MKRPSMPASMPATPTSAEFVGLLAGERVPRYTSYPTALHFTPRVGVDTAARWLRASQADGTLSLYLHVPYCRQLCWYCGCTTAITRNAARIEAYADLLLREIDLVAAHLPERPPVTHLHWGGGTPSSIGAARFRQLMAVIEECFELRPDAERAIELDPRVLDEPFIEVLAATGIGRASLGIQSFDPDVQRAINRAQPVELVARAVETLRGHGIERISFDLLYGLPLQTMGNVAATVAETVALRPDRIAVFGYAHLPALKRHQRLLGGAGLPDAAERLAQFRTIESGLLAAGYVAIGLDHFALPDDPMAAAARQGRLVRNFQGYTTDTAAALIGLGASAISALPEGYLQNHADLKAYRDAVLAGRLPTARGLALTDEDRLVREIVMRIMCEGRADLGEIAAGFGAAPASCEPDPDRFLRLEALGIARRRGEVIEVAEEHRPLLRLVASCFDRYLAPAQSRHALAV